MSSVSSLVECLKAGEVIAYPTEGVWGLGCNPKDNLALQKLLDLKKRSWERGLILIGSRFEYFLEFSHAEEYKDKLLTKWPGPHTWLVPAKPGVSQLIRGTSDKVALRLSNHRDVCSLSEAFGGAIISTSANEEGLPTHKTAEEISANFPGIKILSGKLGNLMRPSTIQDALTDKIIR